MKILSVDTSCDETSAAVTEGTIVRSNVIWSQASAHAEFGGVMPSLAARMHKERIEWVIRKAIQDSRCKMQDFEAIAVTMGPGLAIALGVGIEKAKELANSLKVPLFPINHIEGHLLSPLAQPSISPPPPLLISGERSVKFPALGLVISGGHTELVYMEKIGKYKILAQTQDDALGEALDKAARMLGLGYPGGAVLEKMARLGNPKAYPLPLPMARQKERHEFSYSGLKTAFYRLVEKTKNNPASLSASLGAQQIYDLAAAFQNRAFQHLEKVIRNTLASSISPLLFPSPKLRRGVGERLDLLVGGGVVANVELRRRVRKLGKELGLKVWFPHSKKLIGDNAAMIGVAAGLKYPTPYPSPNLGEGDEGGGVSIDRRARWSVEEI